MYVYTCLCKTGKLQTSISKFLLTNVTIKIDKKHYILNKRKLSSSSSCSSYANNESYRKFKRTVKIRILFGSSVPLSCRRKFSPSERREYSSGIENARPF